MIVIISPAKRLDFESESKGGAFSQPQFLESAGVLAGEARKLRARDWQGVMKLSDNLAELTERRFKDFALPFDLGNARQAIFAFKGDAYQGFDVDSLSADDLAFAQGHMRILSGLYGLLRPLDLVQAYRLEMSAKFRNSRGRNLYDFWGGELTEGLNAALASDSQPVLINLASKEYTSALQMADIRARVITAHFKEIKEGEPRIMSMFAKRARGLMSRYMVQNRIEDSEDLKGFDVEGYGFNRLLSDGDDWVFTRPYPWKKE